MRWSGWLEALSRLRKWRATFQRQAKPYPAALFNKPLRLNKLRLLLKKPAAWSRKIQKTQIAASSLPLKAETLLKRATLRLKNCSTQSVLFQKVIKKYPMKSMYHKTKWSKSQAKLTCGRYLPNLLAQLIISFPALLSDRIQLQFFQVRPKSL